MDTIHRNHYSLGNAELLFGGKATGVKGLTMVFDSGSTYTYLNSQAYKAVLSLVRCKLKHQMSIIALFFSLLEKWFCFLETYNLQVNFIYFMQTNLSLWFQIKKDLNGKILNDATDDKNLPVCWKGTRPFSSIADVSKFFKPLALTFMESKTAAAQLQMPPEAYLIVTVSNFLMFFLVPCIFKLQRMINQNQNKNKNRFVTNRNICYRVKEMCV